MLIITSILLLLVVSCLHNVKGGRSNAGIIIASTAVIGLLFLPLTAFAQQQEPRPLTGLLGGNQTAGGGALQANQTAGGGALQANQTAGGGGPLADIFGGGQQGAQQQ